MKHALTNVPDGVRERQRLVYLDLTIDTEEVARRLGMSVSAVYSRRNAWGWPGRRKVAAGLVSAGSLGPDAPPPDPHRTPAASQSRPGGSRRTLSRKTSSRKGPMSDRDRAALASDMERFVADRIAALKQDAASGRDQDGERTAREIAHYTRSLTTLRGYRGTLPGDDALGAPDGAPPRDLGELRDELRRHLERIWEEERARRLRGAPDAS